MSCLITQGYELTCASVGGVKRVYLGRYEEMEGAFDVDGVLENVAPLGDTPGTDPLNNPVYLFETDIEHSGLEQNGVINRDNGTVSFVSTISLKLIGLNADLIKTMKEISRAPIYAVVEANNGEFFFAGLESALRATELVASAGTTLEDMSGLMITLEYKSPNGVVSLDDNIIGTDIPVA